MENRRMVVKDVTDENKMVTLEEPEEFELDDEIENSEDEIPEFASIPRPMSYALITSELRQVRFATQPSFRQFPPMQYHGPADPLGEAIKNSSTNPMQWIYFVSRTTRFIEDASVRGIYWASFTLALENLPHINRAYSTLNSFRNDDSITFFARLVIEHHSMLMRPAVRPARLTNATSAMTDNNTARNVETNSVTDQSSTFMDDDDFEEAMSSLPSLATMARNGLQYLTQTTSRFSQAFTSLWSSDAIRGRDEAEQQPLLIKHQMHLAGSDDDEQIEIVIDSSYGMGRG